MADMDVNKAIAEEMFKELNKSIKEFKRAGIQLPNEFRKYMEDVNRFYGKNKMRFARDQFTLSKKLTDEQFQELFDIGSAMAKDQDIIMLSGYKEILEQGKFSNWGVTDIQGVIKRLDFLHNEKYGEVVKSAMSSKQLLDLYDTAEKKGINTDTLLKNIYEKHQKTGLVGDELHEAMYESINTRAANKKLYKEIVAGGGNTNDFGKAFKRNNRSNLHGGKKKKR